MKPNINEVKINLDHLLWRTRSKGQDYQFIITPKSPSIDGWFSFFSEVFSNREPSRNPKNIIGKIEKLEDSQFVATCFIDDKYLDSGGRPIKQYLIWFLHDDYDIPKIKKSLANGWGKDFISSSEGLYLPFYETSDTSKLGKENYITIKSSNDNFQKLQCDIREIKCELPVEKPISPHKIKIESEETFGKAIEKAIGKGVDWASFDFINEEGRKSMGVLRKFKKRIPTTVKLYSIKKKIKESPKERERFSRCLAKSFGGNTNDKFIEKLVEEYKSIAYEFFPSVSPKKHTEGYYLIVDVFKKYKKHERLLNKDESEGEKFVSECIKGGASADDICIRQIYLRLRELAKQDKGK